MNRKTLPNENHQRNNIIHTTENESTTVCESILICLSIIMWIITFPFSVFFSLKVCNEFQRLVVFRLGRLRKGNPRGPGMIWILPCVDVSYQMDMRTASFDVAPQEILTKDSVTIQVDAVVYYKIMDPLRAIIQVKNARASTQLLAQTTLRNVAGTKKLIDLLTARESLSLDISYILEVATDPWGVKVERVEIKDVRLPHTLQRAMAAEAEALREAKAKIVAAEGELDASRALKSASDVMAANPITLQLRYLQTLSTISTERNSTVIFPIPLDILNTDDDKGDKNDKQNQPVVERIEAIIE